MATKEKVTLQASQALGAGANLDGSPIDLRDARGLTIQATIAVATAITTSAPIFKVYVAPDGDQPSPTWVEYFKQPADVTENTTTPFIVSLDRDIMWCRPRFENPGDQTVTIEALGHKTIPLL